ncbi:MAG: hypothetical protein JSW71_04165, partial [Gemmatimonadota bacterium]
LKRDMARSMVSAVSADSRSEVVPAAADAVVAEIPVPLRFIGRTISELNIRQSFGASILMIKQASPDGLEQLNAAPASDYAFREGDVLLAMGPNEALRRLRTGVPRIEDT